MSSRFALISRAGDPGVEQVGFPNVLKMIGGTGSEFISLNRSQAELDRNLASLQAAVARQTGAWFTKMRSHGQVLDPRRQFLLEEFLEGHECSCDFMIDGGVRIIRVVKKYGSGHLGYFSGFHLLNQASIGRFGIDIAWLRKVCTRIAAALSIRSGVCMVDFMMTKDGLRVIESSVRPGLSTFMPLMEKIYGYTSLGVLARLRQEGHVDVSIPEDEGLVAHIIAPTTGRIVRFDTSRLEAMEGVIGVHRYEAVGSVVTDSELDHWGTLLGYVLVKNPGPDKIERIFGAVHDLIDLQIEG